MYVIEKKKKKMGSKLLIGLDEWRRRWKRGTVQLRKRLAPVQLYSHSTGTTVQKYNGIETGTV
jgi:hypothetical protein